MASAGVASAGVASAGVATDGVATDGVGSEGATTAGVAPLATALMVAISRLETWTRVFCEAACRDCRTSADECTRRPLGPARAHRLPRPPRLRRRPLV